jgi:hypothetical protein
MTTAVAGRLQQRDLAYSPYYMVVKIRANFSVTKTVLE